MKSIEDQLRSALHEVASNNRSAPDMADLQRRVRESPRGKVAARRAPRRVVVLVAAATLGLGGTAVAAEHFGVFEAIGRPGAFNPGEPLACSDLREKPPSVVEATLNDMGYEVEWAYFPNGPNRQTDSQPPDEGVVVIDVTLDEATSSAIVIAERFDEESPLHRRIRAGQTSC